MSIMRWVARLARVRWKATRDALESWRARRRQLRRLERVFG
jgi:hypothetical protein